MNTKSAREKKAEMVIETLDWVKEQYHVPNPPISYSEYMQALRLVILTAGLSTEENLRGVSESDLLDGHFEPSRPWKPSTD